MKKDFELIGIVGCGKMGRIYRKVFDPLSDRFVIVDPRGADDEDLRRYATLGDVPGDLFHRVQVWCICTPTEKHFESLETILSRNPRARVIVEKPACLSFEVDGFQALLKNYREARVLINRQYADSHAVREMVNALKQYDVAHLDLIRIEFSKDRRPDIDAGRFVDSHFGVLGYEWSHMLTIIQQLLGEDDWAMYCDLSPELQATFDDVQFVSELEERSVLPSGTTVRLRSSMLGRYEFPSFVPYDQLNCHRYIEVCAGTLRFRLQLEPREETRFTGRLFENHFRIEDGGDVLHDSTIMDPFLPRFLQLTLNQLFQSDCPPIDWTTLERIISTRAAIQRHDDHNNPVTPIKRDRAPDLTGTTLLPALQDPLLYPHPVTGFDLRETHISWVLLTGPYAYKIKKPVNFGFVDFSSLAQRRFFCHEEIRLNQRSAPEIYVDVLPISGTPEHPRLDGQGKPFEFAVKMRQFMADATLDHVLAHVRPDQIDRLAGDIATFHHHAAGAERETSFGSPELIEHVIAEVFEQIPTEGRFSEHDRSLEQLRHWLSDFYVAHTGDFEKRKVSGFIRECHGDLHLANLVLLDDRIIAFDGIEFSERLRWIDVINDVAFTVMDFRTRGQPAMARRFLNRYLEFTGDYEGLGLLPFYQVYRALVRVKVAALAFAQVRGQRISSHADDFIRYLSAAQSLAEAQTPWLVIMHGVARTGKSTVSETLLEQTGAIRLRSDVERKRLFGLSPSDQSSGEIKDTVYGTETTRKTYDRLRALARQLLLFGYPVIVDATFLKRRHRDAFKKLAASVHVPFLILDVQAKPATLRERLAVRAVTSDDASEADLSVLEQQERDQEPLAPDERGSTLSLHSGDPFDPAGVVRLLESTRKEGKGHAPG